MTMLRLKLAEFRADCRGATAIEYGLIASATGLGVAAAMPQFADKMKTMYDQILSYFG